MLDPVVTCDGQTYERAQIERWFDSQRPGRYTSPMSNARLTHRNTIPNYALRMAIQEYIRAIDPDSSEQAPEPIAIQAFRPQAPPADSPDSIYRGQFARRIYTRGGQFRSTSAPATTRSTRGGQFRRQVRSTPVGRGTSDRGGNRPDKWVVHSEGGGGGTSQRVAKRPRLDRMEREPALLREK